MADSGYLQWFRRVMWLGVAANVIVAVFSIAKTDTVLELLKLRWRTFSLAAIRGVSSDPPLGFYVPAAIDRRATLPAIFASSADLRRRFFLHRRRWLHRVRLFDLTFGCPRQFYWPWPFVHPAKLENRKPIMKKASCGLACWASSCSWSAASAGSSMTSCSARNFQFSLRIAIISNTGRSGTTV